MPQDDTGDRVEPSSGLVLILSFGIGLFVALLGGLGVVFHDGGSWSDAALTGLGLFGVTFGAAYFRFARRIAEFLSSLP